MNLLASCAAFRGAIEHTSENHRPFTGKVVSKLEVACLRYQFDTGSEILTNDQIRSDVEDKHGFKKKLKVYEELMARVYPQSPISHFDSCKNHLSKTCVEIEFKAKSNNAMLKVMLISIGLIPYVDRRIKEVRTAQFDKSGAQIHFSSASEKYTVLGGLYFFPFLWFKVPNNVEKEILEELLKKTALQPATLSGQNILN